MRTGRPRRWESHYNTIYGALGMLVAAVVLVLLRHDLAQGLSFAVAIVSGAGWVIRRVPEGPASADDERAS